MCQNASKMVQYMSHKKKSGKWGRAINLGPLVNSPYREESPRI